MSRESDAAREIALQQQSHDSFQISVERLQNVIIFGSKSLATFSGAGVVAMLAFLQATVERSFYSDFRPYGIATLICFITSSFLATVTFIPHYRSLNSFELEPAEQLFWRGVIWWVLMGSALFALVASIAVVAGIAKAL